MTATVVNGVASFSNLAISSAGNGYTFQATSTGLTSTTTNAMDVTPAGVATQLIMTTVPPSPIVAGTGFGLVIKAEDGFGTVDTSFDGRVTVSVGVGEIGGTVTVVAVQGVATFSGLTIDQPGSYALSGAATDLTDSTNTITVTAGPVDQLMVSGPDGVVTTNTPFGFVVSALDSLGNVATGFNGDVTLSLSNASSVIMDGTLTATAVNGVASFHGLSINQPGNGYVIQAASTGLPVASSASFAVTNDELVVTTEPPTSIGAGNDIDMVVSAENGSGNVDTSFDGSVTVSLASFGASTPSLGGKLTLDAVNGVASFSDLTVDQAGLYEMSVASSGVAPTSTNPFTINPAAATQLVVTTPPPGEVTVGVGFPVGFSAEDPYGNVVTSFSGSVVVSLAGNPGSATLGGTIAMNAVAGVAVFTNLTLNTNASGYKFQASSTGLTNAVTGPVDVTPVGTATRLVVTSEPPSTNAAGTPFGLVVKAESSDGTIDTSFSGDVTIAIQDNTYGAALGGTITLAAINGVATFAGLTLDQAGSFVLSATTGTLPAADANLISVTALAASQLDVLPSGTDPLPGSPFEVDVFAEDKYGNLDSTFSGNVSLVLEINPTSAALGGTLTVNAVSGIAVFPDLTISKIGSGYELQAIASSLTAGTSPPFNVTTDELVVTAQPPATVPAGGGFSFTVSAEGASGSVDATFNGNVTVSAVNSESQSATLGGTLTVGASNGVATFSGLTLPQPDFYTISVTGANIGGTDAVIDVGPSQRRRQLIGFLPRLAPSRAARR